MPAMLYSGIIDYPTNVSGAILQSTIRGSGTKPAIIGSSYEFSGFSNLNSTFVNIENLHFRNRSKASGVDTANTMTGLNLLDIGQCNIKNVRIDIESTVFDSEQPATGTYGILLPGHNNSAFVRADNLLVTGYHVGIYASEHLEATNIQLSGNYQGIFISSSGHSLNFGRVAAQWNSKNIVLDGTSGVNIAEYSSEHYMNGVSPFGTKWYNFEYDVYDSSGLPKLNINYYIGVAGVGINNGYWTTNMTENINAAAIGGPNPRYVYDGSTAQSNFSFNIGDTAVIGKKFAVGDLAFNEIKADIHVRNSTVGKLIIQKTGGAYGNIVTGPALTVLQFDKTHSIGLQAADSITDDGTSGQYVWRSVGSTYNTYFGGMAYNATPTGKVHIKAASATAGSGQLKFDNSTLPTTPETGLVNFRNGLLFLDSSDSKRDTIATRDWVRANDQTGGSGGGGSPAGNFGNIQLNRNSSFAVAASDSLDYENATGLTVRNNTTLRATASSSSMTLGTGSGVLRLLNSTGVFGTFIGVDDGTGNTWIQAGRNDGNTAAYNLKLQTSGGDVMIGGGTDLGAYKLQVVGETYLDGALYQAGTGNFTKLLTGASLSIFQYSNAKKFGVQAATSSSDDGTSGLYNFISDGASGYTLFGNVAYSAVPHSAVQVAGSFATKYTATATGITLDGTHSIVNVTATGQTITLPTAASITGRQYTIKLTASVTAGGSIGSERT